MSDLLANLVMAVSYLLMVLGLIGAVLPIVPGPLLIWLGALLWAWADGFQALGWPTLLALGVLTLLAWGSDLVLTTVTSRRAGAGWKAVGGAILGGLAGGLLLGGLIPIIGTILATIAGAITGIVAIQYLETRNWSRAMQASRGYIIGFLISSAVEILLALLMIALFAWQAFF